MLPPSLTLTERALARFLRETGTDVLGRSRHKAKLDDVIRELHGEAGA